MSFSPTTLLTFGLALAAVLGLVVLAGRAARLGGFAPRGGVGRRIQVQETTALDPRRRLHLVSCDGRAVLLLTGGGADLVVGWLPEGASAPRGQS
ncbi:MAG TPA: flagellar biosynthetic protein FliO [Acetobacteraceae bacterium]|nr:flagellar biosynthetic protein FliO [Acetobacteraceae bacterium]